MDPAVRRVALPLWSPRAATPAPTAGDLHRSYLGAVLRYVNARIGPGAEADDITADVFGAAFAALHRCPRPAADPDHDPVRAWLFGIARRKLADAFRRRTRRPETALRSTVPAPDHQAPPCRLLADEAARTLQTILDDLPDLQREALRLKYLEELSLVEIGLILRKSPGAVSQLLHRARQAVRARGAAYFGNAGGEEEASR
jgi:RNA polymerase sigma factor (sigma-70 family)